MRAFGATSAATSRTPDHCPSRRVGGRFWALADAYVDDEDEEDRLSESPMSSAATSPTPCDHICEFFAVGYNEEEVTTMVNSVIQASDPARERLDEKDR